jgi:protocatechuate 3,4-dioxygenase beta subunit
MFTTHSHILVVESLMPRFSRRRFLQGAAGLLAAPSVPLAASLMEATPRQPAGPFYPTEPPLDDDNDLTRISGRQSQASGQISDLTGRILDRNGQTLAGMRIEIWQCDANGRYRHPREQGRAELDPNFQGFGHTLTDDTGRYRFRTIRPQPYPGRTPHIHVAVFPEGEAPFITQLYVADEPRNDGDFLYQRVPEAQRHLVTAAFTPSTHKAVELDANWDIVLGITPA